MTVLLRFTMVLLDNVRKTIVPPCLLTETGFRPAADSFWTRRVPTRPCAESGCNAAGGASTSAGSAAKCA